MMMERLDTFDRDEWWAVARILNPDLSRAEFDRQWEEFQVLKATKGRH